MNRRGLLAAAPLLALSACSVKPQIVATEGRTKTFLASAHAQTLIKTKYDGGYAKIAYPMGDVAPDHGACTDVVIRAYRTLGIDLQQLVHEDMLSNFELYPQKWGLKAPDSNIDHRRVPNLMVFFSRFGTSLPVTKNPADYHPGDLITNIPFGGTHIAVVSDTKSLIADRLMVIQNAGAGPKQDDQLLFYPMTGHYRFGL